MIPALVRCPPSRGRSARRGRSPAMGRFGTSGRELLAAVHNRAGAGRPAHSPRSEALPGGMATCPFLAAKLVPQQPGGQLVEIGDIAAWPIEQAPILAAGRSGPG